MKTLPLFCPFLAISSSFREKTVGCARAETDQNGVRSDRQNQACTENTLAVRSLMRCPRRIEVKIFLFSNQSLWTDFDGHFSWTGF